MARMKQTRRRSDDKGELPPPKQPSKWGTAAAGVTHRPPALPARVAGRNPSYLGMYINTCILHHMLFMYHVGDIKDLTVCTRNTCIS